jgi:hypothetical protein
MLAFPDPSASTEYTDPNGSVWEFNGTGWVRQPESSGSGGGGGGSVVPSKIPSGWEYVSREGYEANIPTDKQAGSPLCWGNDIYQAWAKSDGSNTVEWRRYTLDPDGTVTTHELGSVNTSFSVSALFGGNMRWYPWCIRFKNYLFHNNTTGGQRWVRQNEDKTLSFGELSSSWLAGGFIDGGFVTSDDKTLCLTIRNTGASGGCLLLLRTDASGNLTRFKTSPFRTGTGNGIVIAATEVDYGYGEPCYFYAHATRSSNRADYAFESFDPNLNSIDYRALQYVEHNSTNAFYPAFGARYRNGRGIAICGTVGTGTAARGTILGPVVSESGRMSLKGNGEYNSYYLGYVPPVTKGGNNSHNSTGAVGSTCGIYATPQGRLPGIANYVKVPVDITAESYFVDDTGLTGNIYQVMTSDMAKALSTNAAGKPLVSTGVDGWWVCNGVSSDKYFYLYRESGYDTTRKVLKFNAQQKARDSKEKLKEQSE